MNEEELESLEQSIEESLFDEWESSVANQDPEEPTTNEHGDYSDWRDWFEEFLSTYEAESVEEVPAEPARALNSVNLSEFKVFELSNGKYAVFSKDSSVVLVDEKLMNFGTNNLTGLYVSSLDINPNSATDTITVLPYTSSTNIGRNNSNVYYTDYYLSNGYWTSTNYYINVTAEDISKAGYSVTGVQWAILISLAIIIFLTAFRNIFKS